MSLRIIYGRAGSGKTYYCLREIKENIKTKSGRPLVLLVPEQYAFQAEKELIHVMETGGILEAEVLSFHRLAFRIFNEAGGITYPHLHPAGKCMMIHRALEKLKGDLKIFAGAAGQQGFSSAVAGLLTEFKRYHVSAQLLKETGERLADGEGSLLKAKLAELAAIYGEYEALLQERFRDADDDLTLAAAKLPETAIYDGAEIWIDGFSGFTPQEYQIISQLLLKTRRVTVSLCTDSLREGPGDGSDIFAPVKECCRKLVKLAKKAGVEIEEPLCLGPIPRKHPAPRFINIPELAHLEENFFAYPHRQYLGRTESIKLYSAVNIFEEIETVARDIVRHCRDNGLRYRDIAVITGDLEGYAKLIEAVFSEYGISFFLDRKVEITRHPLIRLVLAMLDIFTENWSYEAVFRYLKTGMTGISREEIDRIENYVLACGIRGSTWTREEPWTMLPDLLPLEGQQENEEERLELQAINEIRRRITEPLLRFRQKIKGKKTASEICSALYDFLETIGVPPGMESRIAQFQNNGQLTLAHEYAQIWNILMDVFDQTVAVMHEDKLGLEDFSKLLRIGLDQCQVGLIPASLDQVLVGSAARSKIHEVKALYILGVNDGVFPSAALEEGILSDQDRTSLKTLGLELASDTRTQAFDAQYLVYRILTISGGFLHISWPIADQEGKSLRPSLIISRMRKIFPQITEASGIFRPADEGGEVDLLAAQAPAFKLMAAALRRQTAEAAPGHLWPEVYRWFKTRENWQAQCRELRAAFAYKNIARPVSPRKAAALYGSPMQTSVSRLEKYASCAFAFYVQYGLKAKARKVFRLTPPDVGTFIHAVLERFSLETAEQNISWREMEREWCEQKVSAIIDALLAEMKGGGVSASKRLTALTLRLKRVIARAVWLIAEHIRRGGFEPLGYEIGFGPGEKLPPIVIESESGDKVYLNGRIDRVDALKTAEGTYLRIIDYKSGNKDFKLSDVYYGLQVQLVTYLDALTRDNGLGIEGPVLPGGILYFRVDDPLIKCSGKIPKEQIEQAIMRQLKMKGLLLADVKLIKAMDESIDGASLIIPARINKGDVLGKSSAASPARFNALQKHVHNLLRELCREIMKGTVDIRPYKKKNYTACDYCGFSAICQFDPRLRENRYALIEEQQEEEIWRRIDKGGDLP